MSLRLELSPEERFARVRESVSYLRRPACKGFARVGHVEQLVEDLVHLEEIGALESVAEVLGVTYGGRV